MSFNLLKASQPCSELPEPVSSLTLAAQPARKPVSRRILRPFAFVGRARPLSLTSSIKRVLDCSVNLSPEQWVLLMAEALAERCPHQVPERWLDKLAGAFGIERAEIPAVGQTFIPGRGTDATPLDPFASLSKPAWNEPALLGEWLQGVRAAFVETARNGRAGRASIGSVYTPAAVARAIIEQVHVGPRRVIDPACGAGVFLLEAFQRAYKRRLEGGASARDAASGALTHEIAGIDIDAQALAVAEFSLRLQALRCAGLDRDVPLDLRCADALAEEKGGFDGACECIVGNPPFIEGRGLDEEQLEGLRRRFRSAASGKVNLFAVFVERALEMLKTDGVMAFVLPGTFLKNARYRPLREMLLEHTIESIQPLDADCFENHVVETVVLRVRKKPPVKTARVLLGKHSELQSRLALGPVLRFCELPRDLRRQVELMQRHGVPLSEYFETRDGISTGFQPFPQRLLGRVENDSFVAQDGTRVEFNPLIHRKVIDGCEFSAFSPIRWEGRYIEYDKRHEHHPPHPGRPFNCQLREKFIFEQPVKLLTRQTAKGLIATVDREQYYVRNSVHVTFPKPSTLLIKELSLQALCACLNTSFYTRYLLALTGEDGNVFPQVHIADLKTLPILPGLLTNDGEAAMTGKQLLNWELEHGALEISPINEMETLLSEAFGVA